VVLAEIDGRVNPGDLAGLLYVGATRARSHLVIVAADRLGRRLEQATPGD
jgi:ATP-dependent exoDNAse (exonuclease V) beta subunit